MRIDHCQVDHITDPLGYQIDPPDFSYRIESDRGTRQTSARIIVATDPEMRDMVHDTGWRDDIDSLGHAVSMALAPRTRYYWTVSARIDVGDEATSDVNWFETGKRDEPWQAKWITCDEHTGRHPVFSKHVALPKQVAQARLYICGLGLYEAYYNGSKIGDEMLTPYSNDYSTWLQYQTYDVTDALGEDGVLSVVLGNGWYKGRFFYEEKSHENYYGDKWELIAELHITYADGTTEVIGTDESWSYHYGHITSSGIYDGQTMDMTLSDTPEQQAVLSERTTDTLRDRYSTPIRAYERIKPVELIHTPAGETVLDLGQNQAGVFEFAVDVPKGTTVRLQFGEILQQGNFYNGNLRTAKQEFVLVSDGVKRTVRPSFTYYGYRYVKVEGVPNLRKEDFTALVLHSLLPSTGVMTTGNDKINRLIENVDWALKSNFMDVPTDCPQRDERMGWTGDAEIFSPAASFYRDTYGFYRKYVHDMAMEQRRRDGAVPSMVPSFGDDETSSVWGDAACIIPWTVYRFSGDRAILEDQFDSMKAWVDFIERDDGDDHGWTRKHFHFGDWLALDNERPDVKNGVMGATPVDFIVRVYYMNSARLTAKAASVLGRKMDEEHYNRLADRILADIRNEYFSPNGRCTIGTQTALLMTIAFELVDDNSKVLEELRDNFDRTFHHFNTGFVGTALLCNTLAESGMEDIAYDLLLNEEYPGWLYEVNLGATTVWERWNSVDPDGTISKVPMNSLNHEAYASIGDFLFRHVAGIAPIDEAPGFRRVRMEPMLDWRIGHVDAHCDTATGRYEIHWRILDDTHVHFDVRIPFGGEALLTLPLAPETLHDENNPMLAHTEQGAYVLGPGAYAVEYETTRGLHHIFSTRMPLRELLLNTRAREILVAANPGILETPLEMRDKSMRELAAPYLSEHPEMAGTFDAFDAALAPLND